MKLLLLKDNVKRSIESPFNICLSKADRLHLIDMLRNVEDGVSYGWLTVHDPAPDQGGVDMPPKGWTE